MAARTWNAKKQIQLVSLYDSGKYSVQEIADRLGVSYPTIYNHIRGLGLPTKQLPRRYRGPGKIDFTEEDKRTIIACKEEGMFSTNIALKLGKSRTAVLRAIRELGLTNSNLLPLRVGERYTSLVVLGPSEPELNVKTGFRVARSLVRCDCGKELAVTNHTLRCGNNRSCGGSVHRLKPNTPWIRVMHQYKAGAQQRGLELNLSTEQIKIVAMMPCVYCRQAGSNSLRGRTGGRSNGTERLRYNGIDQVVPCGGYDAGNIVPCCRICNRAKSDLSLADFITWLRSLGATITIDGVLSQAKELGILLTGLPHV